MFAVGLMESAFIYEQKFNLPFGFDLPHNSHSIAEFSTPTEATVTTRGKNQHIANLDTRRCSCGLSGTRHAMLSLAFTKLAALHETMSLAN